MQWLAPFRQWWRHRRTSQVTPEQARRRVRRGADFLDEADPGWYRNVDPASLELASGTHCVLGQLHGDFRLGLGRSHIINLSSAPRASLSPTAYGFRCVQDVPDEWQDLDYDLLDRAWQRAIRKRQERDAAQEQGGPGGVAAELAADYDLTGGDSAPTKESVPTAEPTLSAGSVAEESVAEER